MMVLFNTQIIILMMQKIKTWVINNPFKFLGIIYLLNMTLYPTEGGYSEGTLSILGMFFCEQFLMCALEVLIGTLGVLLFPLIIFTPLFYFFTPKDKRKVSLSISYTLLIGFFMQVFFYLPRFIL